MSTIQHYTVVATVGYDHELAEQAADRIRAMITASEFGTLVDRWEFIGPIDAVTNGYVTYALMPDGSKRGWDTADRADEVRAAFVQEFARWGSVAGISVGDKGTWVLNAAGEWKKVAP